MRSFAYFLLVLYFMKNIKKGKFFNYICGICKYKDKINNYFLIIYLLFLINFKIYKTNVCMVAI